MTRTLFITCGQVSGIPAAVNKISCMLGGKTQSLWHLRLWKWEKKDELCELSVCSQGISEHTHSTLIQLSTKFYRKILSIIKSLKSFKILTIDHILSLPLLFLSLSLSLGIVWIEAYYKTLSRKVLLSSVLKCWKLGRGHVIACSAC